MPIRFYNGYDEIFERLHYSKMNVDPRQENIDGIYPLHAAEKSFFEVPDMMRVDKRSATVTNFDVDIAKRFSHFGVVLVDPDRSEQEFGYPVEKDDKSAKKRGDEINHEYMLDTVQKYISNVEELRAAGKTPLPAQGYVKKALKQIGMADPALEVKSFVQKAAEDDRVAKLEKLVEKLLSEKASANAR